MLPRVVFPFTCLLLSVLGQGALRVEDYRLPRDIQSIAYNLNIEPDIDNSVFKGILQFTFVPKRSTCRLVLNSKNLFYERNTIAIEDDSGAPVELKSFEEVPDLERVIVTPKTLFSKGKVYTAVFVYSGNITDDGAGLYRSSYKDINGVNQWMVVSQMRPVHTRKVFPCLDDPSFRAKFRLSVWHDPSYYVVSNMPPLSTSIIGKNRAITKFDETLPIPVFLTGILMSRLSSVGGSNGFISLAVPQDLPGAGYSAEIGPQLVSAMESLTGLAYPQIKTHQVALPRLVPVAMENWGLFNFRKENILYFDGVDPTVQKQTSARFSGHEVAHAWLGNSVTIAWWDWLWLSEMFAMYLEYFLPHMVDHSWRMDEQMVVDLHMAGLAGDSLTADPLTTRVLTPQEISNKFMGLTYTKGPGLLRMVQNILGINKFFKGIRAYLEKHWGGSVTPRDLWRCLEAEGTFPTRLEDIMSTWTEQPGYPVVSVKYQHGTAVISQSAYSPDGSGAARNASWWIPISYVTTSEFQYSSEPKAWLPPKHSLSVPLPQGSLILLNILHAGFYRVNYDDELWSRLILQLQTDHAQIPALNRAQLVDDSLALALSGHLRVETALDLVSYLRAETDFIAWKAASVSLMSFADTLVSTEIYPIFKKFVGWLVERSFRLRGLAEPVRDSHTNKIMREIVVNLACRMGNQVCNVAADQYYASIGQGSLDSVSPNVKAALMCTSVQEGNARVWKNILSMYDSKTGNNDQNLAALSCSNDPELLKMILISAESTISDGEWKKRYSSLASRRENANNLLTLLHHNVDKIISRFGTKGLSNFVSQISRFLSNKEQNEVIQDLERLGVGDLGTVKVAIRGKGSWLNSNVPGIISFFKSNKHFALFF